MDKGRVYILTGKVCCGKSTYAKQKVAENGGVHLSLDGLMLAVHGPQITRATIDSLIDNYQNYQRSLTVDIINNGVDVFLDWGLWTKEGRNEVVDYFTGCGIESTLYYFDVSLETRLLRNAKRNSESDVHSFKIEEKDLFIFDQAYEAPDNSEKAVCITI